MKIHAEQSEKWVRMNKSAFWEIFEGDRKTAVYVYSDVNGTIETAVNALNEAITELPDGEYRIRAKGKSTYPNSALVNAELIIGGKVPATTETVKNHSNMNELQKMYEEKTRMLLDAKDKDYQILEYKRLTEELQKKFDKLITQVKDFENHINERLDELQDGKGSNGGMQETIKSGVNSIVNHGTRVAVDRFASYKS